MSRSERLVAALKAAGHPAYTFEEAAKMTNDAIVHTIVVCELKSGNMTVGRTGVRPVRVHRAFFDAHGDDLSRIVATITKAMAP